MNTCKDHEVSKEQLDEWTDNFNKEIREKLGGKGWLSKKEAIDIFNKVYGTRYNTTQPYANDIGIVERGDNIDTTIIF